MIEFIRRHRILVLAILVVVPCGTAHADIMTFSANLDEAQNNNCNGTGSAATGSGVFTLDTDTGEVNYTITYTGLEFPEVVSHVHGPAQACFLSDVLYFLPKGSPKIGTEFLTPQQQTEMIAGLHYVNVHTTGHTQGEIRGQILLGAVPTASEWGLACLAGLLVTGGAFVIHRRLRVV